MTNRRTRTLLALFAAGSLALAACGDDGDVDSTGTTVTTAAPEPADDGMDDDTTGDDAADGETIVDIAAGNPDLSILVAAVTEAGLVDTLSGDGPFTVFAPTDDAFEVALEALGISAEELLANPALGDILTYHVLPGEVMSSDLEPTQTVATVQGEEVTIVLDDDGARINDAGIVQTDIEAANGLIHVIDAVILPPSVAEALGV